MQKATARKVVIPKRTAGISVGRTQVCSVQPGFWKNANQERITGSAQYCYCYSQDWYRISTADSCVAAEVLWIGSGSILKQSINASAKPKMVLFQHGM